MKSIIKTLMRKIKLYRRFAKIKNSYSEMKCLEYILFTALKERNDLNLEERAEVLKKVVDRFKLESIKNLNLQTKERVKTEKAVDIIKSISLFGF